MTLAPFFYDPLNLLAVAVLFVWTGFARTGLGFGGAALGLPLLLLIEPAPLLWLPMIGLHLLLFSTLTLASRLPTVDWLYLRRCCGWIIPPAIVGVLGLVSLPNTWLLLFIYGTTLIYALLWVSGKHLHTHSTFTDRILLILGGYIAGTSLTGAPLIVAVSMRHLTRHALRNTLFVLWFLLVSIKMLALAMLSVDLQVINAMLLLPVAAIGHVLGMKCHERLIANDVLFKRTIGWGLLMVCLIGSYRLLII